MVRRLRRRPPWLTGAPLTGVPLTVVSGGGGGGGSGGGEGCAEKHQRQVSWLSNEYYVSKASTPKQAEGFDLHQAHPACTAEVQLTLAHASL